jgi:hypothetical protein
VSNEAKLGSFYTGKSTPPAQHTQNRVVPTHHRTPDALRWRSRLALGVGEGQKLTRCIDSPVRRRGGGAVSNEAKLGSFYTEKSTPSAHRTGNAGRIWHKSYRYGTNRIKGVSNSDEVVTRAKCLHCNKIESPSHIYAQCRNPLLRQQREKVFDSQTKALDRLRIDPTCPEWERRFFRRYHRLSFSYRHDRAEKSWNGTINPTDLQTLLGSHSQLLLSFSKFQEFRKRFVQFVSPLTEAAISMEQLQRQSRIRASLRAIPASSRRLSVPRSITRPPLHPAFRPKSPAPPTPLPRPAHGDLAVPPPLRRLTQKRLTITHSSDEVHQVPRLISQQSPFMNFYLNNIMNM